MSRGEVTVDVEVEAKMVMSRVANHFLLLRIEGAPNKHGFLFKMNPVLPNHTDLSGTEGMPGMWDFCCKTRESSRQPWMDWSPW